MSDASALARYRRAAVAHGRVLLPLGAAIGAAVGAAFRDPLFGVGAGAALGAAWTLLLTLHTGRHAAPMRDEAPGGSEQDPPDADQ